MAARRDDHNAAVEERRLRGAYDCFDNGDHKKALQECDRVLKKYGDKMGSTVVALKALALSKLGRRSDANKLLDDLLKQQPCEDTTLSPMVLALHENDRQSEVVPLYESACKKCPTEENHNSLFKMYVREKERTKAKNVALQLYKITDKRTYYFTAVMHQYLSGKESTDDRQKTMCFTLAEKMLSRLPATVDAELFLEYMILRDSGKYKEALEKLENLTKKQHFPQDEKSNTLIKMEAWDEAALEAERLFKKSDCSDHQWLEKRFELAERKSDSLEKLAMRLLELIAEVKDHDKRRELLLNKMLLHQKLEQYDEINNLLVDFFNLFDGKVWCTIDMLFVINRLPEDKRSNALKAIANIGNVQSLTFMCLDHEFGPEKEDDEELKLIQSLCDKYNEAPDLKRASDISPFDGYLELAADIAIGRYQKKADDKSLLKIIQALEKAQSKSPNGFRLKLRLLWCYCVLNAGFKVQSMISSLNVKYLQLESLGYLFSPFVLEASWNLARVHYKQLLTLHVHSQRDIADGIVNCYKHGSFFKIEEMEDLKARLDCSFELANAKVCGNLLMCLAERFQEEKIRRETVVVPCISWDKLRDNCDRKVLPERYHTIFPSLEIKIAQLRARWQVLKLLVSEKENRPDALRDLKTHLSAENISLEHDLSNAFQYFVAVVVYDENQWHKQLDERTDTLIGLAKISSLNDLCKFALVSNEYVLSLMCLSLAAQSKATKNAILEQIAKVYEITFVGRDSLFQNENPSEKSLRDSFQRTWEGLIGHLKNAEKFLKQ